MFKYIGSFLIALFFYQASYASDIEGSWEGAIVFQGTEMKLVFNISVNDGGYSATMDSPAQGAFGIPTDISTFKDGVLTIEHKQSGLKYVGKFNNDAFAGTFSQAGMEFPLDLSRQAAKADGPAGQLGGVAEDGGVVGSWKGSFSFQDVAMDLVFNISANGSDYSATMDSPNQGAFGIPTDIATFKDGVLTIEHKQSGLKYVGKLNGAVIDGTLYQAGMEFSLQLTRESSTKGSSAESSQQGAAYQKIMQELMQSNLEDRIYTQQEVIEDVNFFIKNMEEVSPAPYLNTDKNYVKSIADSIKNKGDRSAKELLLDFYKLTAAFKAGHIFVFPPSSFFKTYIDNGETFFPFQLVKQDKGWIIESIGPDANPELTEFTGRAIKSINGVEVAGFIESIAEYIHVDGQDARDVAGEQLASFLFLKEITAPFTIEWHEIGSQSLKTSKITGIEFPRRQAASDKNDPTNIQLSDYIEFEQLTDDIAYLNLKSMTLYDEQKSKEYYQYVDSAFKTMKQSDVSHLIIDLRQNAGGRGDFAQYVLPYFANKPFRQSAGETRRVSQQFKDYLRLMPEARLNAALEQGGLSNYFELENGTNVEQFAEPEPLAEIENRFDGKVWALIGPRTFSAGMMMANAIEDYDLGTLVGEPTGGIPNELSDVLPIKTPNSKITFAAPSVVFTRANGDANNTNHVLPDIHIETRKQDLKDEIDRPLEYILSQIDLSKK